MRFAYPVVLLLLLFIPLYIACKLRRTNNAAIVYSSVKHLGSTIATMRSRLLPFIDIIKVLAIALFVIALARPQGSVEIAAISTEGTAIMFCVDRSGSMREPVHFNNRRIRKIDALKQVLAAFVLGSGEQLKGRKNDIIGLVSFARFADTMSPLTLSHRTLTGFLKGLEPAQDQLENSTSIGDGIALSAARLHKAEQNLLEKTGANSVGYNIKNKIIVLITDGENNSGIRSPSSAAEIAKEWGIKVYAIGLGVGSNTLQNIAETTGGRFFNARSMDELVSIYAEIDKLETSQVSSAANYQFREYYQGFLGAGIILAALYYLLISTILRTAP